MMETGATLLLTVKETSRLLSISKNSVYALINDGTIPHVRLGRSVRVPRFGLEQWIAGQAGIGAPVTSGVSLSSARPKH